MTDEINVVQFREKTAEEGQGVMFTTHDPAGRLLVAKLASEASSATTQPYGLYVDGMHDGSVSYVVAGAVEPRPGNPTTLSGTTLSNIPLPSQIVIDGVVYDATGSTMELVFPLPGTYEVIVVSFPPLNKTFQVTQS
jgi:hypothetical protein